MRWPTRREAAAGLGAAMTAGTVRSAPDPAGLHARAARRGMAFGCSVWAHHLDDARLRAAILRECGVLVPEIALKWPETEAVRGRPTFEGAERIVAFARENGLALRGHTAIWHNRVPPWALADLPGPEGGAVLDDRVRGLLGRFRGRVASWDVVNEAVEPHDGRPDGLRDTVYLRSFGPDFLVRAFRAPREADPGAQLVYNEYGLEYATAYEDERRRATLSLLVRLRREGLVDALGIQSHLTVGNDFRPAVFRRFLAEVADLGLAILLTEFTVGDRRLSTDLAARDAGVCEHAARYLDAAFDERAVRTLVTWGLSVRTVVSTMPDLARRDGFPRGLPLDEDMNRIPLWNAIAKAFDDAPTRG